MEYEFENNYMASEEMIKEYINKIVIKKTIIFGWSVTIIGFLFGLIFLKTGDRTESIILFTITGITLFTVLLIPYMTYREFLKNENALNNGKSNETMVSFGDNIAIKEGNINLTVEYSQIIKIYNLKYSYVLKFGKNNSILVVQDKFTKGNFDDFKKFLINKVNIEIK